MYKFIILYDLDGKEYLINVSEILFIEYSTPTAVTIGFEDGSRLMFRNSKEIYEMLILKPWQMNLVNFFRWLFKKRGQNEKNNNCIGDFGHNWHSRSQTATNSALSSNSYNTQK